MMAPYEKYCYIYWHVPYENRIKYGFKIMIKV